MTDINIEDDDHKTARWVGHTEESLIDDMVVSGRKILDEIRQQQEKKLKIKSHETGETE